MGAWRALRLALGISAVIGGAAACAGPVPHIALPSLALGEPSFFPTLEAYTATPIVGGNQVRVLLNGEEIFPAQLDAIRAARRTITYAQYIVEDGLVTKAFAETVAVRCRAGVAVHILLDAFGSLDMPPDYAQTMAAAGCRVVGFRPLDAPRLHRANYRNHRRVLVIDGRVGFTGGSGLGRSYMGNGRIRDHWRDTDVRVEGPVVQYLQGAFAENWLEATGEVLGGEAYFPAPANVKNGAHAQVVRSSPTGGASAIYTTYLLAISAARHSIHITNPYFLPTGEMLAALSDAAARGVEVSVLVPGQIDHTLVRDAGRRHFGRLLKAGVAIHQYRPGRLHAKTMVIDGVWVTVGSTNLDNRSFAVNDELNLVIYDVRVARRLEAVFAADLAVSDPIVYREWRRRGLWTRLLELVARPLDQQF